MDKTQLTRTQRECLADCIAYLVKQARKNRVSVSGANKYHEQLSRANKRNQKSTLSVSISPGY